MIQLNIISKRIYMHQLIYGVMRKEDYISITNSGSILTSLTEINEKLVDNLEYNSLYFDMILNKIRLLRLLGNFNDCLLLIDELKSTERLNFNKHFLIDLLIISAEINFYMNNDSIAKTNLKEAWDILYEFMDEFSEQKLLSKKAELHYTESAGLLALNQFFETVLSIKTDDLTYVLVSLDKSFSYFEKMKDLNGIMKCQIAKSYYYMHKKQFSLAKILLEQGVDYYREQNNFLEVALTLDKLGVLYCYNAEIYNYGLANKYFQESLVIKRQLQNHYEISISYMLIGRNREGEMELYSEHDIYSIYSQNLKLIENIHNDYLLAFQYFIIGRLFLNSKTDLSEEFFLNALQLSEKINNKKIATFCYLRLCNLMHTRRNLVQFEIYVKKASNLLNDLDDRLFWYSLALHFKSYYLRELGRYNEAYTMLEKRMEIVTSLDIKQAICSCYIDIGRIFHLQNRINEAYKNYKKALSLLKHLKGKYSKLYQIWTNFLMILLIKENHLHDDGKIYLDNLKSVKDDQRKVTVFPVAHALYLLTKKRMKEHFKAQEILEHYISETSEKYVEYQVGFIPHLTLCEIYLKEFQTSKELEVYEDIIGLIENLNKFAEKNNAPLMIIYSKILYAKLKLISNKYDKCNDLLQEALKIAKIYEMHHFIELIGNELENLIDSFNKVKDSIFTNPSINEKLEQENFSDYIRLANKLMQNL